MHRRKTSKDDQDDFPAISVSEASPSSPRPPASLNGAPAGDDTTSEVNGENHNHESELSSFAFGSRRTKAAPNGHGGWGSMSQSQRTRVASVPTVSSPLNDQFPTSQSHPPNPPSAGPYRTSFQIPRPLQNGLSALNGSNGPRQHQAPAMRQSLSLPMSHNSHVRTRSVTGPFSPSTPSPLSGSFPIPQSASYPPLGHSSDTPSTLVGSPNGNGLTNGNGLPSSPSSASSAHTRRHSRLHSRNLSVYFPRPGSLPVTTIDEDGAQEINFSTPTPSSFTHGADEGVLIPSASSPAAGQRTFREGFTFGARPPDSLPSAELPPGSTQASRRGHHHKHSLSHNFFSFLEPGSNQEDLHTQPTPMPVSPWNPISPFPMQKSDSIQSQMDQTYSTEKGHGLGVIPREKSPIGRTRAPPEIDTIAVAIVVVQFILGASLWVVGQQIGSLSCTGLGYWVVFDSFGVGLAHVLPGHLARPSLQDTTHRFYGYVSRRPLTSTTDANYEPSKYRNSRVEALAAYAQAVYLLFASVYVCKETVEHLLLSAGEGEGHHHHHGDEVTDIFG